MSAPQRIARYYDRNTARFLRLGGSGAALAIHRPLWGSGVTDAAAAAGYINTLLAAEAERWLGDPPGHVLDMGCGVGGTVLSLAARWPDARLAGVTLSAAQVARARAEAARRGLAARCRFDQGDFLSDPAPGAAPADLVVAVESHVHAPGSTAFLRAAAARLAPGGVLLVADDMLDRPEADLDPAGRALLSALRRGWHLGHLSTSAELAAAAGCHGLGLLEDADLTPLIRLDRLRDRLLRIAGPLADRLGLARVPFWANAIGGNALTEAYRAGLMRYRLLAFMRVAQ